MKKYYEESGITIYHGDCRQVLTTLPPESVQCCVTSPPYFGLRDYGVDGQIGLEETPEQYVAEMVAVFREVRRVLKDDGAAWLNLGDSYNARPNQRGIDDKPGEKQATNGGSIGAPSRFVEGIKPKDLIGIPWSVAFALRADGWYLRQDIIWAKPNPMPESVTDRCTKAHEYIFLLAKSDRYFYDSDAVAEASVGEWNSAEDFASREDLTAREIAKGADLEKQRTRGFGTYHPNEWRTTRNRRSVWSLPVQAYSGAHFATFPPDLIKPCIMAGSRPAGKRCDCDQIINTPTGESNGECDPSMTTGRAGMNRPRRDNEGRRPITRREQRSYAMQLRNSPHIDKMAAEASTAFDHYIRTDLSGARPIPPELLGRWLSRGWLKEPEPCTCPIEPADIVLDPFNGSGTTGEVSRDLGRRYVGIELNRDYIELTKRRLAQGVLFGTSA